MSSDFDDLLPSASVRPSMAYGHDDLENPFADMQSSSYAYAYAQDTPSADRGSRSRTNSSAASEPDSLAPAKPPSLDHSKQDAAVYDQLVSPMSVETPQPSSEFPRLDDAASGDQASDPGPDDLKRPSFDETPSFESVVVKEEPATTEKQEQEQKEEEASLEAQDAFLSKPPSVKTVDLSSSHASQSSSQHTVQEQPTPIPNQDQDLDQSPPSLPSPQPSQGGHPSQALDADDVPLASGRPSYLITVSDPHKVGSGLTASSHVIYTVRSVCVTSSATSAPTSARSVLRRYRDFLWLFDSLIANNPGVVVPPPPEKSALGRFGHDFIENRRKRLQVFLGKVAAHPILWNDPDFKMFLESDSFALDVRNRPAPTTPQTPSFFLPGILSSVPRFEEADEFFINRQSDLQTLETALKTLSSALLTVTKARSALLTSIQELSHAIANIEACELTQAAKRALAALEELTTKIATLEEQVILSGESTLSSVIDSWIRLSSTSVRFAFNARLKSWHAWQKANGLRATMEKRRNLGQASLQDVSEQEARADEGKREFLDLSRLIKFELLRFDEERMEDFRLALVEYVDGLYKRQVEVVNAWSVYEEIVKAMAGASKRLL